MNLSPLLFLVTALLCFSVAANESLKFDLPNLGDSAGSVISPQQEKELGEAFYRSLHAKTAISKDYEIEQYIQNIGAELVANSDVPGNHFQFFVVYDTEINAFAGPGGYIGVNSGLILLTEAESELASVLAHEIAHVSQRHLSRAFEAASRLSIPAAASTLAAVLLGTQSPELGQAALVAIQAGSTQYQIDFTRDNEKEADRIGMQTLSEADFDPRSMPVFFERLQKSSRFYGQGIPEFLRTHPVSASRIADTRGRAEHYPYRQYPDSSEYLLAKAKLRVLTATDINQTIEYFLGQQHQGTDFQKAVARYGMALAYSAKQNFDKAKQLLQQLIQQYPHYSQFVNALARIHYDAEDFGAALALYRQAHQSFPEQRAITFELIDSLLKTEQPELAKSYLDELQDRDKNQPKYFELLARSYAALNRPAESHRYLAEYYYQQGQTDQAILQIKLAKQLKSNNFYLQAILDERLKFFTAEERQRKQLD